jgi:uncharacterized protein YndB with AHSA1/START domain
MPDILHRFTIDAPRERVHDLVATKEGVERWWNAHPRRPGRGHARRADARATNWGADLTSLKSGAERGEFAAYPAGEMSRWS